MTKETDYKALSLELDEALAKLQSPGLSIDDAIAAYERGMVIAKELEAYLRKAENKVTKVKEAWEARSKSL